MKSDLSKLPNIGKDTEAKLVTVGITSAAELKEAGVEQAFLRLQAIDPGACLSLLYGLSGAIEGVKWNQHSPQRKQELQEFYHQAKRMLDGNTSNIG
ncbi:TfoX/Sxy family protein [uncultured Acetobacteroides sp.]|uniref:TfoX/Sxy family protein n=1 Tax=uncultured Acetobacteroides sp. TaxID=1760811 RepID=UPI0029F5AB33|nr:TfoX/Sxy family protein [uncultured Acetobacteroides sp.]